MVDGQLTSIVNIILMSIQHFLATGMIESLSQIYKEYISTCNFNDEDEATKDKDNFFFAVHISIQSFHNRAYTFECLFIQLAQLSCMISLLYWFTKQSF